MVGQWHRLDFGSVLDAVYPTVGGHEAVLHPWNNDRGQFKLLLPMFLLISNNLLLLSSISTSSIVINCNSFSCCVVIFLCVCVFCFIVLFQRLIFLTTPSTELPKSKQEQAKLLAVDGQNFHQKSPSTKDGYFPVVQNESHC